MTDKLKLLFVGQTWNGSSARSLRDALAAIEGVDLDDIGEDHYCPKGRSLLMRCINRLLKPIFKRELGAEILGRCATLKPDVVVIYKGILVTEKVVASIRSLGIKTVNVFPDYSPHAYGSCLRRAIGQYDLVNIGTQPMGIKTAVFAYPMDMIQMCISGRTFLKCKILML